MNTCKQLTTDSLETCALLNPRKQMKTWGVMQQDLNLYILTINSLLNATTKKL